MTCLGLTLIDVPPSCSVASPRASRFCGQSRFIPPPERTKRCSPSVVTQIVTRRGFPVLRPMVVRVTSFSRRAASMTSGGSALVTPPRRSPSLLSFLEDGGRGAREAGRSLPHTGRGLDARLKGGRLRRLLRAETKDSLRQPPALRELVQRRVDVLLPDGAPAASLQRVQRRLAQQLFDVSGAGTLGPFDCCVCVDRRDVEASRIELDET